MAEFVLLSAGQRDSIAEPYLKEASGLTDQQIECFKGHLPEYWNLKKWSLEKPGKEVVDEISQIAEKA